MPNYAYTSHHISGDAAEVQQLYQAILRVQNHPEAVRRENNYYGSMWLGFLMKELMGDTPKMDCRGQITGYFLSGDILWLDTESAWGAPTDLHQQLCAIFPSLRILYFVDVTDEGEMVTNDTKGLVFSTRYGIGQEDEDELYFDSLAEVCTWIDEHLRIHVQSESEANEAINNYAEEHDVWMSLHKCFVV